MAAPGAPVAAMANPVGRDPKPSPTHQMPRAQGSEAAMASRSQRPLTRARPRTACAVTNRLFHTTGWDATMPVAQMIEWATGAGWPIADWARSSLHQRAVKSWGWAWRPASSSHSSPRTKRTRRRLRGRILERGAVITGPWGKR